MKENSPKRNARQVLDGIVNSRTFAVVEILGGLSFMPLAAPLGALIGAFPIVDGTYRLARNTQGLRGGIATSIREVDQGIDPFREEKND